MRVALDHACVCMHGVEAVSNMYGPHIAPYTAHVHKPTPTLGVHADANCNARPQSKP